MKSDTLMMKSTWDLCPSRTIYLSSFEKLKQNQDMHNMA